MNPESHNWATSLPGLHDQAWKRLGRGVADRRAAGRHPTLVTVDASGRPQARTVVLRAADRTDACLRIYTDRHSDKVKEVQANPVAGVHFWDSAAHLQIRLQGDVSVLSGESVRAVWGRLPDHARDCYGRDPAPGNVLDDALAYRKWPEPDAFAVLEIRLQEMDILHLGRDHRRARFERSDGWAGRWVVP
ncbi:pyridoxamine 5'-phosphate oxidase family protein [Spiribacter insolitus]|uniref:Pyridoxamine 5'-phosphate oxidase family protein n=1 Tax=Spiribacter insolitus TaxID=3122417 RepID=A0ABV3T9Z3_9GAMM